MKLLLLYYLGQPWKGFLKYIPPLLCLIFLSLQSLFLIRSWDSGTHT